MRPFHKIFTAAFLLSAAVLPDLARADEAPPAVKAFLANLERQTSVKPSYDALKADGGGNVTITNLTLSQPAAGESPAYSVKMAEVVFSGITEQGQSLYEVGKASFSNTTLEVIGKDFTFSAAIPQAAAEGWYIRALGANPTPVEELLATSSFARTMNSGKITLAAGGHTVSIDGVDTSWNGDPNTGAGTFNMKVSNIAIPEGAITPMDPAGMWKQLGYSGIGLDITSMADMKLTGERLGYTFNVGVTGRDIGSLSFGASLQDIPMDAYDALMKAQMEGKEPDYAALSPQLQNVVVNGATLRFEDASIVNKRLPLAAAAQGMDEKTLRASIPPMVQLTLVQFQNEAFTKQVVEAVTAFFNAPKSLTLAARPAGPLKISDLTTMDPNKPGEAISKLGLSVTAND